MTSLRPQEDEERAIERENQIEMLPDHAQKEKQEQERKEAR